MTGCTSPGRTTAGSWHCPGPTGGGWSTGFELRHPDGWREEVCDPTNPRRAPGAFGDKSVVEFPDYRAPGWLLGARDRRPQHRAADPVPLPAGRGLRPALDPGRRRADRAAAAAGRARRPGVRHAVRPDHVRGGDGRGRPAAPAPARAARSRRARRVVLGERQLRPRAGAGGPAGAPPRGRGVRPGGRDGRQPGRAGGAARAAPAPRARSAACSCSPARSSTAGSTRRRAASPGSAGSPASSPTPGGGPWPPSRCRRR